MNVRAMSAATYAMLLATDMSPPVGRERLSTHRTQQRVKHVSKHQKHLRKKAKAARKARKKNR